MTSNRVHRLSFYTSYRQFYLVDPGVQHDTSKRSFWSEEALERGLAVGSGVLGIGTSSYGHIRCFFELADAEPILAFSPWQRIVEGSIRLTTGSYAILDCPYSFVIHQGTCTPGEHRLRLHGAFLDQLVERTAGDDYFDFYWLVLWPAAYSDVRVIKHFDEKSRAKEHISNPP